MGASLAEYALLWGKVVAPQNVFKQALIHEFSQMDCGELLIYKGTRRMMKLFILHAKTQWAA
jgi:hypothetical protein